MSIGGILTAMVTPFDAAVGVDEAAFVRLLGYLLENGSDGVVVAGTTGEGPTLHDEERFRLFELAVKEAGDAPVIAGTGSNDTAHSVRLTSRATELGVDGVLVVTPYYNKPNRGGLIAHFEAVAEATDKPVVLYNIPSRCVIDLPNDLLAELAGIPNVAAVKQANPDHVAAIAGLDLLAGNDDMLAEVLDLGGTGGITVASHLFGGEMRRMIDEPERRGEIDASLADAFEALAITANPIPVKAALNLLGIEVGGLRLPLVEATVDERKVIHSMLDRHGLLTTSSA